MKKNICILFGNVFFAMIVAIAQPPQPGKPPNAEERVQYVTEKMEKELKLSSTQKEKVAAAYKDFFSAIEKQRTKDGKQAPPPPPPPPVSKEIADKLSSERDAKIKTALSADQYQKYIVLEKSMRPPMPTGKPGEHRPPIAEKKQYK